MVAFAMRCDACSEDAGAWIVTCLRRCNPTRPSVRWSGAGGVMTVRDRDFHFEVEAGAVGLPAERFVPCLPRSAGDLPTTRPRRAS